MPSLRFVLGGDFHKATTPEQRATVARMRRDGIVKLPRFIDADTLADMRAGIDRLAAEMDARPSHDGDADGSSRLQRRLDLHTASWFDPEWDTYTTLDPFRYSNALVRFAMSAAFTGLVNSYYRKQALFARGIGLRNLPRVRPRGRFTYQWHNDAWGRKVNATLLLSDVGETDQYVAYKKGTHRLYHSLWNRKGVNVVDDEIEQRFGSYQTVQCTGQAGDVWLFDSNGFHTLSSHRGRTRNVYVLMYYCDRTFVYRQTLPEDVIRDASPRDLRVFAETLRLDRTRRRTGDTSIAPRLGLAWPETLPRVRHWLL